MALFGKKKTENEKKEGKENSNIKPVRNIMRKAAGGNEKKAEKKEEKDQKGGSKIREIKEDIILEPWITEKSHGQMAINKYIFRVHPDANKKKIKDAVKTMYNVNVLDVNIVNIPPKKRTYGRFVGKKSGYKKALVTLKEGDKIELFKGV